MGLRDIPREEWDTFLHSFIREHRNELVTLEKSDLRDGLKVAARAAPLMTVMHDRGAHRLSVTVGEAPSGEITHTVTEPDGIAIEEPAEADEDPHVAVHFTGGGQHLVLRSAPSGRTSDS
jgi:hypothetical protein